ncbi:hypothetical protein HYALB_00009361 [Hymenoscyphus albidus]|uniref:Uncharacterized protein n=1 Tax=Hymenoscyphus albidus TaxID=595503 RepID=A0A9N9PW87_9HELO|nr:hypothetical protein HYALB_00009361 [Hymenoscyphus albidus]
MGNEAAAELLNILRLPLKLLPLSFYPPSDTPRTWLQFAIFIYSLFELFKNIHATVDNFSKFHILLNIEVRFGQYDFDILEHDRKASHSVQPKLLVMPSDLIRNILVRDIFELFRRIYEFLPDPFSKLDYCNKIANAKTETHCSVKHNFPGAQER